MSTRPATGEQNASAGVLPAAVQQNAVYQFGPFSLFSAERRLLRSGQPVDIGGRALDVLILLAAQAPRVVSKAEIFDGAWRGLTVEESALRYQLITLRRVLGDGKDGARYIATVQGRGYALVAPVVRSESRAGSSEPPTPTPTNLPLRPALIGRDEALTEVTALLDQERLVTIVGPGGVGKTRLAIGCGWLAADAYPDGVWLIDLAPLADSSLVVSAVATGLDVARGAAELSAAQIASAIRARRLLLILDNCEYLVDAAAALASELLEQVPGLTVLATSQESLRLDCEQVYRLGPLSVPPPDAADIAGYSSVALFARRLAAHGRFDLDEVNAADVADICRRLDGMPLSLEMAAARAPALGLGGLRASLEARLVVLSAGLRTADVRHQTLRNTVEWSVGLLDDADRAVFRQLGVFSGGFSLEAAMAAVVAGGADRWAVAAALGRLVDKSLVTLESGQLPRYRLLETLRLYAREMLQASGEWDGLAERHARHFCDVFARALDASETMPEADWQAAYLPELDNLRSALDWTLADPSRHPLAVELTASSGFVWPWWSLEAEGRRVTGRVVAIIDERTPAPHAAAVLLEAGRLLCHSQDHREGIRWLRRSAAIFRESGDELGFAKAKLATAEFHLIDGALPEAATAMSGVRETLSAGGHERSLCRALDVLGSLAIYERNFAQAIEDFAAIATLAAKLGDALLEARNLMSLALLEFSQGDIERAIELGRQSLASSRLVRFNVRLPLALHNLAAYLVAADRMGEARALAEEALLLLRSLVNSPMLRVNLQMWALIGATEGCYAEAAQLIGWVDAAFAFADAGRLGGEQQSYERLLALLAAHLSDDALHALFAEGARWSPEQAVNFALQRVVR
jgi:predicted ATPase